MPARLDEIAVMLGEGELTQAQARTATERAQLQLSKVEALMASAGRVDVLDAIVTSDDVAATWAATPTDRQRAIVNTLTDTVLQPPGRGAKRFDPTTVEITWTTS